MNNDHRAVNCRDYQHGDLKNKPCTRDADQIFYSELAKSDDHAAFSLKSDMNAESSLTPSDGRNAVYSVNLGYVPDEPKEQPSFSRGANVFNNEGTGESHARHKVQQKQRLRPSRQQVIIFIGGCFTFMLGLGFPLSIGAFFVDWLEAFQSSRAETAIIQSACSGITLLGGVVVGFLIRRFGIRIVIFTGSILASTGLLASWFATSNSFLIVSMGVGLGLGSSCIMLATNVSVTLAFQDGRAKAFALSLLTSAAGFGSLIFPIILQNLKQVFGWRGALLLMSGVYLNVCVVALVVTSPLCLSTHGDDQVKSAPPEKTTVKWHRLLNPLYFTYLVCVLVGFGTIIAVLLTVVDFSLSKGLSAEQGIVYLLLMNGSSTLARFITGFVLLIPRMKSIYIFCASFLMCGTALIIISWSDSYTVITACFTVYGFGSGGFVATYGLGILSVVGEELYAVAMGLGGAVSGLSNSTFGIIMGALYDMFGSYDLAFRIFGCMSICVCVLPLAVSGIQTMRHSKTATISQAN